MEKPRQPARHFSQQEAELILRRAAHLDTRGPQAELSLEDLERIAADAGIAPENIRRAAASLEEKPVPVPKSHFFGEPTEVVLERTLQFQLTRGSIEKLAKQMNDLVGGRGSVHSDGERLTWTRKPDEGGALPTRVSLWNSGGRLRIELRGSSAGLAGGLYGGILGGVGGGVGFPSAMTVGMLSGSVPGALGTLLGVTVGAWGLARAIYINAARHRRAQWEHTLRTLCEHATTLDAREED
ncbi:hypothetical protein HPC49_21450 [Pyxidicoccus fallax]|uniref:Uncharacterized protein n=1 Tax=Pyxidicoccus fallax TaxID=394095 RepID=A0A848LIB5_9BACT|nr:hypothetical protein [Pyxidicoccus fallax]NMO17462.1 hypothetical protein [Pyxidicoccus fallax]NPC80779.1 hypothetical protein [Pyxidicoccus fallax]